MKHPSKTSTISASEALKRWNAIVEPTNEKRKVRINSKTFLPEYEMEFHSAPILSMEQREQNKIETMETISILEKLN